MGKERQGYLVLGGETSRAVRCGAVLAMFASGRPSSVHMYECEYSTHPRLCFTWARAEVFLVIVVDLPPRLTAYR